MKHFNIFLFIIFLLTFVNCSTTRYVPVKGVEKEVVNYKDSIRIRDSIVVIPVERIVDVVPAYDTLRLETTQAKAKAAFVKINNGSPIKAVIKNEKLEEFKDINLERKVMVKNK